MESHDSRNYNFFLKGSLPSAVLLIHGITGTPSEMNYIGRKLHKAGFTVLCNTLPRHCQSLNELKKVTWQEIFNACLNDLNLLKQEYKEIFVGGLSMGALMAIHLAYKLPAIIKGIIALAPTFFYDGWAVHKKRFVLKLSWYIPWIRNTINIKESWPYGLKDEYIRRHIERFYSKAKAKEFNDKTLLFGSPFFPMACLYQHYLFTKLVKKELSSVKQPILIVHAREDDMTSLKNAEYVFKNIGSQDKSLVVLEDSYHMITIDQEKERVAEEIISFLNKHTV